MSDTTASAIPGYWTLTATSAPSWVRPRWTWPMLAAAAGSGSISASTSSGGRRPTRPRARRGSASTRPRGRCRAARRAAAAGTRTGRGRGPGTRSSTAPGPPSSPRRASPRAGRRASRSSPPPGRRGGAGAARRCRARRGGRRPSGRRRRRRPGRAARSAPPVRGSAPWPSARRSFAIRPMTVAGRRRLDVRRSTPNDFACHCRCNGGRGKRIAYRPSRDSCATSCSRARPNASLPVRRRSTRRARADQAPDRQAPARLRRADPPRPRGAGDRDHDRPPLHRPATGSPRSTSSGPPRATTARP